MSSPSVLIAATTRLMLSAPCLESRAMSPPHPMLANNASLIFSRCVRQPVKTLNEWLQLSSAMLKEHQEHELRL